MTIANPATSDPVDIAGRISALEDRLRHLSDRQEIVDVYRRYTRGLNRCDLELLTAAFWEDAKIRYGFVTLCRDEWIESWRANRYLKGLACQAHHITNETVDIEGDSAHVESYLIAFWCPPNDSEPSQIAGGRYIDRVDRRNGEWRVAVREFIPHFWSEGQSIFSARFSRENWPEWGLGCGDKSDLCYRRPLEPR